MTLAFHEYANLFPLIEGQEFFDLAEDIRANGLRDRIDLIDVDGALHILDGRNRYRALVWLATSAAVLGAGWEGLAGEQLTVGKLADHSAFGLYKHFTAFDGAPLAYVLSKNLSRRHLDESQRAMVAAKLANMREGRPSKTAQICAVSDAAAAAMLNVGERSVEHAKAVQRSAAPEIVQAVDRGHLAVSAAAEIAAQPAERQAAIVAALPRDETGKLTADVKKALGPVIKEIRAEKVAAKKEKRAEREQTLGRKIQALPAKTFGVAIEDFEWHHDAWSMETGANKHPSMHYETALDAQTPEEIVARCAERFACLAADCVLFKWSTIPHLATAIKVLELQGFRYVTHLIWNKERAGQARGTGYWFTGEHEIVLVGVRGKVVPPAVAHFRSNFSSPVGEHSEKPDHLHDIIEFHWPNTPKVEFNARRVRPGWQAWGFDAPVVSPEGEIGEIADGGSDTAAESPALVDAVDAGKVNSVADIVRTVIAVPPADRPGPEIPADDDDGLTLPAFLRRYPAGQSEMDLARRDRAPPEIVDGTVQTRLPLTGDELDMQIALVRIAAGGAAEGEVVHHLVGAGYAHCTTQRIVITDQGRDWLAMLPTLPAAINAEARP